jgi:alpha-mannosidase
MDTIVPTLEADPSRRFIQVEMAFFHPWWLQQTTEMRERFKRLVESGQMELTNGGWCMHDEATTIAVDQIDQMTLGHKFLLDTFGPDKGVPRTGWSIDPFVSSRFTSLQHTRLWL